MTPPAPPSGAGMRLPVAEAFYSVQGEGCNAGLAAYFIRLAGCDVGCAWCDSKGAWDARDAVETDVAELMARVGATPACAVVVTGGEPLMHPLGPLTEALHRAGLRVLLETSGTHPFSGAFDWVCLSPKFRRPPTDEACARAHELKVVIAREEDFAWAESQAARVGDACVRLLQPEWSAAERMLPRIVDYVKAHPRWRISLQTHKYLRIP